LSSPKKKKPYQGNNNRHNKDRNDLMAALQQHNILLGHLIQTNQQILKAIMTAFSFISLPQDLKDKQFALWQKASDEHNEQSDSPGPPPPPAPSEHLSS
jgi:hypothetical protein